MPKQHQRRARSRGTTFWTSMNLGPGVAAILIALAFTACENGAGDPEPMSNQDKKALEADPADTPSPSPSPDPPSGTSAQRQVPSDPRGEQAAAPQQPSAPPSPQEGAQGAGTAPGEPLPAAKVDSFVEAYMQAQDVRKGLREELASVQDEEKALEIQQRATREMEKAVESTGMDFETYASLTKRLQADADFRTRVQEKIQEMSAN